MESALSSSLRKMGALLCAVVMIPLGLAPAALAQQTAAVPGSPAPVPAVPEQPALLPPGQLDALVAPVALYPDPLLSEVLAASTYPLEVVEAQQWLQRNGNLQGQQLIDASKQQNWDPAVQALVTFPDAMKLLTNDIQWTTTLGNAFLAQQADVMSAVQRMRAQAEANGKLASTPQQVVSTDTQDGQSAIEIQPANPQVIYVPVYSPSYVWGAPSWDYWDDLWYPGWGFGFGFGPGIYLNSFYPGWGGWGGWGWGCGWFGGGLFVNAGFFGHYGFHGYGAGFGYGGRGFGGDRFAWAHNPDHRMGVPYPNRSVATRFNSSRYAGGPSNGASWSRVGSGGAGQRSGGFGQTGVAQNRAGAANGWRGVGSGGSNLRANGANSPGRSQNFSASRGAQGGAQGFAGSRSQSFSAPRSQSFAQSRSYAAPRQNFSTPRQSYSAPRQNFSAPRQSFSAPRQSFSAPRSSGSFGGGSRSFSGGGFSGGRSFSGGGGGRSFSGGGGGRRR